MHGSVLKVAIYFEYIVNEKKETAERYSIVKAFTVSLKRLQFA